MNRFQKLFKNVKFSIIGMIHVGALPGTPKYNGNWNEVIERAQHEARIYAKYGFDSIMIENMHDTPFLQPKCMSPESVACMTVLALEVRSQIPDCLPCGVQVLACGNKESLAIAKAAKFQFIRVENFAYAHVADEGLINGCAGQLLRYRRYIDAEDVLIFTDIKMKHCAHAISDDVTLLETAKTAESFLTDGIVITGRSTGLETKPEDLIQVAGKVDCPILIGSGVTIDNVDNYFAKADAVIIGTHLKESGNWKKQISEERVKNFMEKIKCMREENNDSKE